MNRKIKLIWDFYGPDSKKTAEHHAIHLEEFAKREKLELNLSAVTQNAEQQWSASLVVVESEMPIVRDALKPHRGVLEETT